MPFVPVFIRTLQLFGSTVPTDHPDRLGPPDPAERASQKTPPGETRTRPDAAAGAARCLEVATRGRGASRRLVIVRPVAAGALLAHGGLTSTRGCGDTMHLGVESTGTYAHPPGEETSDPSPLGPTTRPRRGWMVSAFASRAGRTPRAALYMVGGVAGGAGRRKVA